MGQFYKLSASLALFLLVISGLNSQELPSVISLDGWKHPETKMNCGRMESLKHQIDKPLANVTNFRPYDVLKYDIDFDWYNLMNRPSTLDSSGFGIPTPEDFVWTGINTVTLKVDTAKMTTIDFDAVQLKINSVKVNNLTSTFTSNNGILSVNLNNPANQNDTLIVEIHFEYNLFVSKDFRTFRGFFLMPKRMYFGVIPVAPYDSAFVEERLAYTMSEPEDARYWMPCNDSPHDKALVTVKVKVPSGYSVASNGLLQNVEKNTTDWTYFWKENSPVSTYLVHIASSKFKEYSEYYPRVTNPLDTVELKYFVWQKDYDSTATDGSQYNAKWTFEKNLELMKVYSTRYLEYPFDKYGLDVLFPFVYGGMEHQTITSINRVWLRYHEIGGLAHELAHQWLGDLVTCSSWNDIWMNEGGATWSEAIWQEWQWGRETYFSDMVDKRDYYLQRGGSTLPPIYGLPVNTIFAGNAVLVYQKASWIYHMLRTMLGDDEYFRGLRAYMTKFSYKSANKEDIRQVFEDEIKNPAVPYKTYFDQWLLKSGHPVFDMSVSTTNTGVNTYKANITLKQIQPSDNISDIFQVPVRVIFKGPDNQLKIDTLVQTTREQNFTRELIFYPTSVMIDTTHILCEVQSLTTSVQESNIANLEGISVYPNPVVSGNIAAIELSIPTFENESISIFNNLGEKVMDVFTGTLEPGTYKFTFNTRSLPTGVYYIRANDSRATLSAKIVVID
jgi:aminopeptidase N